MQNKQLAYIYEKQLTVVFCNVDGIHLADAPTTLVNMSASTASPTAVVTSTFSWNIYIFFYILFTQLFSESSVNVVFFARFNGHFRRLDHGNSSNSNK